MRKLRIYIKGIVVLLVAVMLKALPLQAQNKLLPLIPYPQKVSVGSGSFIISKRTVIVLPAGKRYIQEAALLNRLIAQGIGSPLKYGIQPKQNIIKLVTDPAIIAEEGYRLMIDAKQIVLLAKNATGILRGIETIRQLMPDSVELTNGMAHQQIAIPCVHIEDHPVYAWRGMHL